jgi:hypothetical protein
MVSSAAAERAWSAWLAAHTLRDALISATFALALSPKSWKIFGKAMASFGPVPLNEKFVPPAAMGVFIYVWFKMGSEVIISTDLLLQVLSDSLQVDESGDVQGTKEGGVADSRELQDPGCLDEVKVA